ncbi:hypothetical protein TrRE_jg7408 [Triparma retinervis]|uniref:Uncharacterized protein n=1 Tax=Triparma retinervis TaxID=2557542 RepID=A0A9W7E588_9STRA|nr:hypothetical protein TrRE_jg7408 [Triparma retinervis]
MSEAPPPSSNGVKLDKSIVVKLCLNCNENCPNYNAYAEPSKHATGGMCGACNQKWNRMPKDQVRGGGGSGGQPGTVAPLWNRHPSQRWLVLTCTSKCRCKTCLATKISSEARQKQLPLENLSALVETKKADAVNHELLTSGVLQGVHMNGGMSEVHQIENQQLLLQQQQNQSKIVKNKGGRPRGSTNKISKKRLIEEQQAVAAFGPMMQQDRYAMMQQGQSQASSPYIMMPYGGLQHEHQQHQHQQAVAQQMQAHQQMWVQQMQAHQMQAHQIYMNTQQQQNNAHLAWVQTQNGHTAQDRGRAEEQPKEELQLDSTLQRGYDGDSSAYEPPAKKSRTSPTTSEDTNGGSTTENALYPSCLLANQFPHLEQPFVEEFSAVPQLFEKTRIRSTNVTNMSLQSLDEIQAKDLAELAAIQDRQKKMIEFCHKIERESVRSISPADAAAEKEAESMAANVLTGVKSGTPVTAATRGEETRVEGKDTLFEGAAEALV